MKIVIPGGTGQVGTLLARAFYKDGHTVTVLSRNTSAPANVPWRVAAWDMSETDSWQGEIDGADVVINLAGRSVNCRYTPENRKEIIASRVDSTRAIGEAIANVKHPPAVWLQASTATIYSHRYDTPNDEVTGIIGRDEPGKPSSWRFSIDVATAWEEALDAAITPQTRKVKLRSAMVMSPDKGGVFDTLLTLVRLGLGGASGNGRQYVSWVHERDFIRAIYHLIQHDSLEGNVNICSPNPLPNADFMQKLREAWRIPFGLPAADWMLEIGAVFLKTETELILKSRRVVPTRLLQDGFTFCYPNWADAARELCQRSRNTEGDSA